MIRFGLRLTIAGGREAIARLALIVAAVAVGVGLLLTTVAGLNGVNRQNARYAWLETGYTGSNAPADSSATDTGLWWLLRADYFDGQEIGRLDLAPLGPNAPVPPGITRLPQAGQYYASPAMAHLLRATPHNQLADRYPGQLAGIIGSAALPAPNSLVIVVGRSATELSRQPDAVRVARISTTVPSSCSGECALGVGTDNSGIVLILTVVAAALLFPVLIFIGGATRLSAARREQRFAAMRLIGATPRQIAVIATVESTVATALGVIVGFGLFLALRNPLAGIPFTGQPFFVRDLALSPVDIVVVGLGVPIAAAVTARLALRRVSVSPLGVTRRVTPKPPRPWRLLPLAAGGAELAYFAYLHDIGATTGTRPMLEALAFLTGVLLVMAGLVIAGPWLTLLASRLTADRARRPATLIAARRLADDPRGGFRAISGLVLAVFVATCATGIITAIEVSTGRIEPNAVARSVLVNMFAPDPQTPAVTVISPTTVAQLSAIPGVTGLATIRNRPAPAPNTPIGRPRYDAVQELISCGQLRAIPALGHCPDGATVVAISPDYGGGSIGRRSMSERTWPAVAITDAELATLPIDSFFVGTDGSSAAIEQARTVLDQHYPAVFAAETLTELAADSSRLLDSYRRLADVVILTSLPIAGCSLAVSIAGGLAERKRVFSLLRLAGTPLTLLGRVVIFESVVPLIMTAVVSVGAGLLTAQLFLRAQLHESLHSLGLPFYLTLAAGLVVALGVVASTRPLLSRLTAPEIARND